MCRKAHGSAFATYAAVPDESFHWIAGEDAIAQYESSPGFERPFCERCGSVVAGEANEGRRFMPMGCVDGDPGARPMAHIFVASKAAWYQITDELRCFDAYPPGGAAEIERPAAKAETQNAVAGSCLCGSVRFELLEPPGVLVYCHCHRCQKARSSAHAANFFLPAAAFRWIEGESELRHYKVPEAQRFTNAFCRICGGLAPRVDANTFAMVPGGSLDADPGTRVARRIWVSSNAPWYEITDTVPRYEEHMPAP
jgi:hypothetical protein